MPATILSLPPVLRQKIFEYVNALPAYLGSIVMTYRELVHYRYGFWANPFQTTRNLLLVCRTFYAEVSEIMYRQGRFVLRVRRIEDLYVLYHLRICTIKKLKHLTIDLQDISRPNQTYKERYRSYERPTGDNEPVDKSSGSLTRKEREYFDEWRDAIRYMLRHVEKSQFHFSLVTEAHDFETATLAVRPLAGQGPIGTCAIRLACFKQKEIQDLAQKVALEMTGSTSDEDDYFRFLDLPPEVRRMVFEYTDLVTPWREVEWTPKGQYTIRYADNENMCRRGDCDPNWHYAHRYRFCLSWQDRAYSCQAVHSAFGSKCVCWTPPLPILLVCRSMHDEAEEIFYRSNRVIILPTIENLLPEDAPTQFDASLFLRSIRPSALANLHFLELVFPPFRDGHCMDGSPVHEDWKTSIALLETYPALTTLAIRVYFTSYPDEYRHGERFHAPRNQRELDILLTYYRRIINPLASLSRLSHLYVHLAHPMLWVKALLEPTLPISFVWNFDNDTSTRDLEINLGKELLMDRYEVLASNEPQYTRSQWYWWCQTPWYGGDRVPYG